MSIDLGLHIIKVWSENGPWSSVEIRTWCTGYFSSFSRGSRQNLVLISRNWEQYTNHTAYLQGGSQLRSLIGATGAAGEQVTVKFQISYTNGRAASRKKSSIATHKDKRSAQIYQLF